MASAEDQNREGEILTQSQTPPIILTAVSKKYIGESERLVPPILP